MKEKTEKLIDEILAKDLITEKEINLLKNRLNQSKIDPNDHERLFNPDLEIELEQSHIDKGISWLKDHTFKQNGEFRAGSTISGNESDILKQAIKITFVGFNTANSNAYRDNYLYTYRVHSENDFFDYTLKMGNPYIL